MVRIEPGIDGTRIHVPRPGRNNPGKGIFGFGVLGAILSSIGSALSTGTGAPYLVQAIIIGCLVTSALGLIIWRLLPMQPKEYTILLDLTGVTIDGHRMGQDVTMTMHAEKLVFKDHDRTVDVWHGVKDLEKRMELRGILENALSKANERYGEGAKHVPKALVRE